MERFPIESIASPYGTVRIEIVARRNAINRLIKPATTDIAIIGQNLRLYEGFAAIGYERRAPLLRRLSFMGRGAARAQALGRRAEVVNTTHNNRITLHFICRGSLMDVTVSKLGDMIKYPYR
ncbi:hypothetical protein EVAR_49995_1 [Eumeta japonica]|uniref:Uncharacterized protein n=1 Tax=Eumeta variegata TaxID=151549 RepID=A0A4C1XNX6_EUMVA|nr:hypothetical protein EVAR_49995_1 [Eumeta japonica]